jgi:hypothetical protein
MPEDRAPAGLPDRIREGGEIAQPSAAHRKFGFQKPILSLLTIFQPPANGIREGSEEISEEINY